MSLTINNHHIRQWIPILVIVMIAVGVHANTIFNDYAWDDPMVFSKNPDILEPAFKVFGRVDNTRSLEKFPYYRPLSILTFVMEQRIHHLTPALMHFLNVLLHTINSVLVYILVRTITSNKLTPLLTALLFSVHPITTESVAFLSGGRNTLLATTFGLSAYIFHYKATLKEYSVRYVAISTIMLFAALLSKELSLGFVIFICYLEIDFFKKNKAPLRNQAIKRFLPHCIAIAIYFLIRSIALANAGIQQEIVPFFFSRIINNIYIIPRYLLTILCPPFSSIYYTIPDTLISYRVYLTIAWGCIVVFLWWLLTKARNHVTLFGLTWSIVFWLPTSGIIFFPSAPMADRYLYISIVGFWIIIADQVSKLLESYPKINKLVLAAGIVALVLLSGSSITKNFEWKNDITLFSKFVKQHPEQAFGHHNLGTAYLELQHDLPTAEQEFLRALQLNPRSPQTHTQLGYIAQLNDRLPTAFSYYSSALVVNPRDAEAMLNRGILLDMAARNEEALLAYKNFLNIPDRGLDKVRQKVITRIQELEQASPTKPNRL